MDLQEIEIMKRVSSGRKVIGMLSIIICSRKIINKISFHIRKCVIIWSRDLDHTEKKTLNTLSG